MITIATTPTGRRSATSPGTSLTVELRGELDLDSTASIEPTQTALVRTGPAELRLDLGALAFCDTSGINLFLWLRHRCARAHITLVLTGVRGQPARVIRLVRFDRTIACRFAPPPAPRPAPVDPADMSGPCAGSMWVGATRP
ncbi:STAS domain-containing protein [Embleya scabrispora]|uniref:STAS domain-containing protein n=1 Tax=Embleya scabrispora TaxID=159449 RepID=UPI0003686908|nr:STAS domain-containing protein [Embleya scabrispora]